MNSYPAVSVIIPVYKVEEYLERCVKSVLSQSFTDYEIILVDDGSPDNCPRMCDEFSEKYKQIKTVHKKNGGLSSARNAGMNIAKGKYIFFLDSDDWIKPNTLKEQYKLAETEKVDFIRTRPMYANHPNHVDGEVCVFGTENGLTEGKYNRRRIENEILPFVIATNKLTMGPIVSAWGGLYRADFIKNFNLKFYETIRYSEDLIFNVHATMCAESFYFLDTRNYYYYYFNQNSITKKYHPDIWENDRKVIEHFDNDFSSYTDYNFPDQLRYNKIFYILDALGERRGIVKYSDRKDYCKRVFNDEITKRAFANLSGLDISFKQKIILMLIKYRQAWLLAMI